MAIAVIIAVVIVGGLVLIGAISSRSRPLILAPALQQVLDAAPWEKLDNECWTRHRERRPTIFFRPQVVGPSHIWVHYYDADAPRIPGLHVEVNTTSAATSEKTELPGLPDGLRGSLSFEAREGESSRTGAVREEHLVLARDWLADAEPLAQLPGGNLEIDPSHVDGFRITVHWDGGAADELALAVRVLESVEKRILQSVG